MNREIKFRAFDPRAKKMFNVDVLAISQCTWDCPDHNTRGVSLAYQPHIPVMQYTGLKDKSGKDVYEGDLLISNFNYFQNIMVAMRALKIYFIQAIQNCMRTR